MLAACLEASSHTLVNWRIDGTLLQFPTTEFFSHIEVGEGRVWMLPEGVKYFARDLSEQEQKVVWTTHCAPAADLFTQKLDGVAWRSKPSSYILATSDRTVRPELQRFLAPGLYATLCRPVQAG